MTSILSKKVKGCHAFGDFCLEFRGISMIFITKDDCGYVFSNDIIIGRSLITCFALETLSLSGNTKNEEVRKAKAIGIVMEYKVEL